TPPLAANRAYEATALYVAAFNRQLVAALQAGVGEFPQRLIEEEADVRRRNFVGGDVVAQLGIALRMLCIPRQVLARQLTLDEFGIFGEEQNAPLKVDHVRALLNFAVQKR